MVEIDDQIMAVMQSHSSLSCYEVAQCIQDSYGITYPTKRVRNRLDSLCNYNFLTVEKVPHGKGMPLNVYSLPQEGSL